METLLDPSFWVQAVAVMLLGWVVNRARVMFRTVESFVTDGGARIVLLVDSIGELQEDHKCTNTLLERMQSYQKAGIRLTLLSVSGPEHASDVAKIQADLAEDL